MYKHARCPFFRRMQCRATKRKGENQDEDYVLPSQSRSRRPSPQYSLRQTSSRRITQEIHDASDNSDSEESLEKGAVEGNLPAKKLLVRFL